MSRFVLVDHSLRAAGSHHLDYARLVLEQAENRGFEVHVIAHRGFEACDFPRHWHVQSRFRYDLYHKYCVAGGRGTHPTFGRERWVQRLGHPFAALRAVVSRRRRRRHFSRVCHEALSGLQLRQGDVVFFPAVSEFDLESIVEYLHDQPAARAPQYCVQFHFGVLPATSISTDRRHQLVSHYRRFFDGLLARIKEHPVQFYATTDGLVEEFNQFVPRMCAELPYPVNPGFQKAQGEVQASAELQITCAGLRPEQGQDVIGPLVDTIGADHLANGRARLQLQMGAEEFESLTRPDKKGRDSRFAQCASSGSIQRVAFPLPAEKFQQLIQSSDLLLFLYDRFRYSVRCSSILVEALTAGIPVIVPAGCWLGDQIAEPTNRYLADVKAREPSIGTQELLAKTPPPVARWPATAGWAIIEFQATAATTVDYVRVDLLQLDPLGAVVQKNEELHRRWADERVTRVSVQLEPSAVQFAFRFRSLTDDRVVPMRRTTITYFAGSFAGPKGAVGLAAANAGQVPELLTDLLEHYSSYRKSAAKNAEAWFARHDPQATFDTLVASSDAAPRARTAPRKVA